MRHPFELDPAVIHSIIHHQAGSIGKALIELIMNSVDAGATFVRLAIDKSGFECSDDGQGFASHSDVIRYFGRFGTPHVEGDAKYGRFRLGRGQIMAHAATIWRSNSWQMSVDTLSMGYSYDLEELKAPEPGCNISGQWYEVLEYTDLMICLQEVRDLVRYTPIAVSLNGSPITKDPSKEHWDYQDENAYYRVKPDGPVGIYNQGVLVRNDSSHMWGCGGLVVTKKPIGLNVSRTEILRKTCPAWKAIAAQLKVMADELNGRIGDHRKTEARREQSARALLGGDTDSLRIFGEEEVITLLPGKKHVTFAEFIRRSFSHEKTYAVVERAQDVPKGEAIAREGIALLVHPSTMYRFGCYSAGELRDDLDRIIKTLTGLLDELPNQSGCVEPGSPARFAWYIREGAPTLLDYYTIRDSFKIQVGVVSAEKALTKPQYRAWSPMRLALERYAAVITGGRVYGNYQVRRGKRFKILLGESNSMRAWTDGEKYIAFNIDLAKKLASEPLKTAHLLFSLLEHEVAHEGDSMDAGHDGQFFSRFHDINIEYAQDRQQFIHLWLRTYTYRMQVESRRLKGSLRFADALLNRANDQLEKRNLPAIADEISSETLSAFADNRDSDALLRSVNRSIQSRVDQGEQIEWTQVLSKSAERQKELDAELLKQREAEELFMREHEHEDDYEDEESHQEFIDAFERHNADLAHWRSEYSRQLGVEPDEITEEFIYELHMAHDDDHLKQIWMRLSGKESEVSKQAEEIPKELKELAMPGETMDMLDTLSWNAGFTDIGDYLRWRKENAA